MQNASPRDYANSTKRYATVRTFRVMEKITITNVVSIFFFYKKAFRIKKCVIRITAIDLRKESKNNQVML